MKRQRTNSLIQSRRNRETGTTIEVHDLDVPGRPSTVGTPTSRRRCVSTAG